MNIKKIAARLKNVVKMGRCSPEVLKKLKPFFILKCSEENAKRQSRHVELEVRCLKKSSKTAGNVAF